MIEPPYAITRQDDAVTIQWGPEAGERRYEARALRLACPCAECVEEMSGRPMLEPARVPLDVRPTKLDLVGNYGIRIWWSDGHHTGIYTFELLRRWER
ncbi:MAG: DUF971 domain-containing protein [Gemmatimonadales bacterium]